MMYELMRNWENDPMDMRDVYCDTLLEMARKNRDIVALDADLMVAIGLSRSFAKELPEQTVDCGIMEANMIGVAAGMSLCGKIPFAHSFGPFASRRVYDQIFVSGAYAKTNIKIIGSDPGITAALNGGTHMPFEDMGILRCIPEITLLEPTDNVMLKNLLPKVAERYGVVYMRVPRKSVVRVYADGCDFEIGKAAELRDGNDLTIIASGYCVAESLKAAKQLAAQGIQARVLNLFTWKPIDEEAIVRAAEETGAIVTAENHTVCGGLGSAVAEVLAKKCPVPVEMIGVQDRFGEVGKVPYLSERFGLNAQHIVQAAATACIRKQKCCSD